MATIGQRGKWGEQQVKKWMQARSDADAHFAFHRYPDPRAGSLQPVPADFGATCRGVSYLVEVKEVTIPATRKSRLVPEKNFSADKVARMRKWQMAGSVCWVVVCHLPAREWRLVPLEVFAKRQPSWDVSGYETFVSLDALLLTLFGDSN